MYQNNYSNKNSTKGQYSVITEQGDLGLGVNVLTEAEQNSLKKKYKSDDTVLAEFKPIG